MTQTADLYQECGIYRSAQMDHSITVPRVVWCRIRRWYVRVRLAMQPEKYNAADAMGEDSTHARYASEDDRLAAALSDVSTAGRTATNATDLGRSTIPTRIVSSPNIAGRECARAASETASAIARTVEEGDTRIATDAETPVVSMPPSEVSI